MKLVDLKADIRTETGKGAARELRRAGKIPAILYGPGSESVQLAVGIHDLEMAMKEFAGEIFLSLDVDGTKRTAVLKELQADPASREFRHADFYEISENRKISAMVPVASVGKAPGVELGGMLQIIRRKLEVVCFPQDVPEKIEVNVSTLQIGQSVHVNQIDLGDQIEIPFDVNFTVLTVVGKKGAAVAAQ